MKLFQNCGACGASIRDKKLLQLLEVYPVRCPVCGELIKPLRPDESDIIVAMEEEPAEEATFFGKPKNFSPNIDLTGGRNDNADK